LNPSDIRKGAFVLQELDIFSHLSPGQLRAVDAISRFKHYRDGDIVFYEGEESRYFHFLVLGEIAIIKSSAQTETIAIHRFRAPSMIAEMATLKGIVYPASAQCIGDCVLLKTEREPFLSFLGEDPSLSITIISSLISKISALELSLQRHSAPNAMSKVARLIRDDIGIFSRLKGTEIAHLIGITPETLSRTLKKFKQEAIIIPVSPRGFSLVDSVKLDSLADNYFPLRG